MDYGPTVRKLDDLPSDNGKTVDCLAGALLRLFVRVSEIDALLGSYGRRLAALEHGIRPQPQPPKPAPGRDQGAAPAPQPAGAEPGDPDGPAVPHRGRGRPPGSKNRPKPNGAYHADDDHEIEVERDLHLG